MREKAVKGLPLNTDTREGQNCIQVSPHPPALEHSFYINHFRRQKMTENMQTEKEIADQCNLPH